MQQGMSVSIIIIMAQPHIFGIYIKASLILSSLFFQKIVKSIRIQQMLFFQLFHLPINLSITLLASMETNQRIDDTLLTGFEQYQNDLNTKCAQWRSQPASHRKINDISCLVLLLVLLLFFFVTSYFYISEYNHIRGQTDNSFFYDYSTEIYAYFGISLAFSYVYMLIVYVIPKFMVYWLIILSLLAPLGIGILFIFLKVVIIGILFFIIFAIFFIYFFWIRKRIELGIILLKAASVFLTAKFGIFAAPILKIIANISFSLFWIVSLSSIFAVANKKTDNKQSSTIESIFAFIWIMIWFFLNSLFYYMTTFTIAVACSFWYYKVEDKHYFPTAFKWMFRYSFGSLVFSASLSGIASFARFIIDQKRKTTTGIFASVCYCIMNTCCKDLQAIIRIFNHNAIILMSVTGENFIDSTKTATGIISRFYSLMSVIKIINGLLIFWGAIIAVLFAERIHYLQTDYPSLPVDLFYLLLFISIFGPIIISSMIISVLTQSVNSVFIFYCLDVKLKDLGYSSNNIPTQIYDAFGSPFQA